MVLNSGPAGVGEYENNGVERGCSTEMELLFGDVVELETYLIDLLESVNDSPGIVISSRTGEQVLYRTFANFVEDDDPNRPSYLSPIKYITYTDVAENINGHRTKSTTLCHYAARFHPSSSIVIAKRWQDGLGKLYDAASNPDLNPELAAIIEDGESKQ